MNTRDIEKIRKKFIVIATLSFVLVMLTVAGLIYATNLVVTRSQIRGVLNYLIDHDGELPHAGENDDPETEVETGEGTAADNEDASQEEVTLEQLFGSQARSYSSPDFIYATRYFSVLFDENDQVTEIKTGHIAAVDEAQAEELARKVTGQMFSFGSYGVYYYKVAKREDGGKIVVFLDSANQVFTNHRLLFTALALIGLGMIIAFLLVRGLSFRIVRTEIENVKRQKQFITNASHELKTPLSVIRANTEVEQMINGENEWNVSTMKQVNRLQVLIDNLVRIARAEEKSDQLPREMINIAKSVSESVETFRPVAIAEGKALESRIEEKVMLMANEADLRQLTSLLVDNAIKYCDEGGKVTVVLSALRGRTIRLIVSNSYAEGAEVDYSRFFDRFYRKDEAHTVDKGGYGIGLSIAESLVQQYRGSINVSWKDGEISFVCVLRGSKA